MQLYQLTEALQSLYNLDDVDEALFTDTLESLQDAFEDKAINITYLIKNLQADEKALDEEIQRLTARKKSKKSSIEYLKRYLLNNMKSANVPKIITSAFTISVRKNPQAVKITDEKALPAEFFKVTYTPDKTLIKDKLKSGKVIDGAELSQSESLMIR